MQEDICSFYVQGLRHPCRSSQNVLSTGSVYRTTAWRLGIHIRGERLIRRRSLVVPLLALDQEFPRGLLSWVAVYDH